MLTASFSYWETRLCAVKQEDIKILTYSFLNFILVMLISPNITVDWTQKIKSESRLLDALGIQTHHLHLQEEFTAGITSVTLRARYYTLLAYYYQYLRQKKVIDATDFEKVFILSSLAHHDGNATSPSLAYMYNNYKFINDWDQIDPFTLDFDISGFGRTYYNRQMEVFRCVWTDEFGLEHLSAINKKLADTLSFLNPEDFTLRSLSKYQLTTLFDGFCICSISENQNEIDILSKLMFGFFSENDGTADIDELKFFEFMRGNLDLEFIDRSSQDEYSSLREQNSRRRNTLFLFLQIIAETSPKINELDRFIWDAIYFGQNRQTKERIEFNKLEKTRQYWEFFQLNVYYVFLLEKILERINHIVIENIGINKRKLITALKIRAILTGLSDRLGCTIDENTSMTALFDAVKQINQNSRSSLASELNESWSYDYLHNENTEIFFSECLILLALLYIRYSQNSKFIVQDKSDSAFSSLYIEDLFGYLRENGDNESLISFLSKLMQTIVNKHLLISAQRFAAGTKNWIFAEEDERLYSARTDIITNPRDNRWLSIRTILSDLGFIFRNRDAKLELTDNGVAWLHKMQSI